jgi:hypothetical protein
MTQEKQQFPTPIQDIALNTIFNVLGERRNNRTAQEYAEIALRLPPLKVLTDRVNSELKWMHSRSIRSGVPLPELCRFKAGDERITYETYPQQISYETVRSALNISRLRRPRGRRTRSL